MESASPLVKWLNRLNFLPASNKLMVTPGVTNSRMLIPMRTQGADSSQIAQGERHSSNHADINKINAFFRKKNQILSATQYLLKKFVRLYGFYRFSQYFLNSSISCSE